MEAPLLLMVAVEVGKLLVNGDGLVGPPDPECPGTVASVFRLVHRTTGDRLSPSETVALDVTRPSRISCETLD